MKMKSAIAMAGLTAVYFFSTAFVGIKNQPESPLFADESDKSFLLFLSQFKKVDLPYSIGLEDMEGYTEYRKQKPKPQKKGKENVIKPSKYLPESNSGKFSRMGPPTLAPIARFYPNSQMVAVVYSSTQQFGSGLNQEYNMVLYDLKGNILPKKNDKRSRFQAFNIAYSSLDKTMTCSIDSNGNITQQVFENQWRKSVTNFGLEGNSLTGLKAENTLTHQIDAKGNIAEKKDVAVASRVQP